MNKAVFIDRDGTLNEMVYDPTHGIMDSPRRPDQVVPVVGAGAFLREVRALGYLVIVVTNQPGMAKGTLTEADLEAVNTRLAEQMAEEGGGWDDLLYAPTHPTGGPWARPELVQDSDWRKPEPGMLFHAMEKHAVDLSMSWMIGDGLNDVQAGRRAGCRTALVTRLKVEHLEKMLEWADARPDYIEPSLAAILPRLGSPD